MPDDGREVSHEWSIYYQSNLDLADCLFSSKFSKLWTQEPENFDEEVKSLGTAWRPLTFIPTNRQDIIIINYKIRIENQMKDNNVALEER